MSAQRVKETEALLLAAFQGRAMTRVELFAASSLSRAQAEWALGQLLMRGEIFFSGGGERKRFALTQELANEATLAIPKPGKVRDPNRNKKKSGLASCSAQNERVYDLTPPRSHIEIELETGRARLPILRADEVTTENQLFHCPRFVADLSAGACLGRQLLATDSVTWADRRKIGRRNGPASPVTYRRCMGCAIGETVAERVAKGRAA